MSEQIGVISEKIIKLLNLNIPVNTPIHLGESNIKHMKKKHLNDYSVYGKHLSTILSKPDYVGINPKDNSLEYVKAIPISSTDFIKVAVRVTTNGSYYARSLYKLNSNRVNNFISKGFLKAVSKE